MSDRSTRQAERAAATGDLDARVALARERLRAGADGALVVQAAGVCAKCYGAGSFRWLGGHVCGDCNGTGKARHGDHVVAWGPAPLAVLAPIRALVGCEVSRAVLGWGYRRLGSATAYCVPDSLSWLGAAPAWKAEHDVKILVEVLARLAADLPPVRVRGAECWMHEGKSPCLLCKPTPGDRYMLAAVVTAAARAALPVWEASPEGGNFVWEQGRYARSAHGRAHADDVPNLAPRRAIEAAEAWLACPCPEREREALDLFGELAPSLPTFAVGPIAMAARMAGVMWADLAPECVEASARLTDVRPAIRAEVLARTGGVW